MPTSIVKSVLLHSFTIEMLKNIGLVLICFLQYLRSRKKVPIRDRFFGFTVVLSYKGITSLTKKSTSVKRATENMREGGRSSQ